MDRKIILDVETTGFSPEKGDKMVELACIEIFNDSIKGKSFHVYINPERDIPLETTKVHGITNEKVANCNPFREIAKEFLDFVQDSLIIAHNASFDSSFIDFELKQSGYEGIPYTRYIDTLEIAKKRYPRERNSLNALCNRFKISLESRKEYHGAMIDVDLLAEVYLNLITTQENIFESKKSSSNNLNYIDYNDVGFKRKMSFISEEEKASHEFFIKQKIKNNKWGY